ncbi:hypothetical protein DERP_010907 [Dermatophagoides pteronyssinus]|uniref:Uncharacterized protein n=1 Tax=Dermatophagoides pteronyssinus TaxID=6956 RepID=A0ABQ8JUN3_DERPT|nr:hypothetical protein DERP_010907 [Dermatophagoides pteronyssinus]
MFCNRIFRYLLLLLVLSSWNLINGQAPYEYSYDESTVDSSNDLINPFIQTSLENVQLFKTKVFKLIEAQNQYFELIQQKRPVVGDYEYVKFDVLLPDHEYRLQLMDNQRLISVPEPNLPVNNSQLLISIDSRTQQLNVWQFVSDSMVIFIDKYRIGQTAMFVVGGGGGGDHLDDHQCIKLKSFIIRTGRQKYRLKVVALFRHKNQPFSIGLGDFLLVLSLNFIVQQPSSSSWANNIVLQTNFIEEQVIKFERIPDFDILYYSRSQIYLSLIQSSEDSNYKFELSVYHLINDKIFDKIAWQISDYILNANHVKLATMDQSIYLICSYNHQMSRSSRSSIDIDHHHHNDNFLNVFKLIEHVDHHHKDDDHYGSYRLQFISSVNNQTRFDNEPQSIHHLTGNNDFIFLVKLNDIDVYWWDGNSLLYYDTIVDDYGHQYANHKWIRSFALAKLLDQPPLIMSTNGKSLNLYYKIYSKFIHNQLDLLIDWNQNYLDQIEIFTSNRQYFVWLKFVTDNNDDDQPKYYCQFARVKSRQPESNEQIYNLDTCLMDLRERIDRGLQTVQTLKQKSENLLVISSEQPYIDVDVDIDTMEINHLIPEQVSLRIPKGKITKGDRVVIFLDSVDARIDHLENRINQTVMLKSSDQSISSSIEFYYPIRTESLQISSVESHFYLNDINFDLYSNGSLTIDGDQVIEIPFRFTNGLQIDRLNVQQINGIPMKWAMLTTIDSSTQFIASSNVRHHYYSMELFNGTTATRINDVRLVDLYQDRSYAIQLIRGRKTFTNLTVEQIVVDTNVNNRNFHNFLSKILWLENPEITVQQLQGDGWIFSGEKLLINFEDFVNNTGRLNNLEMLTIKTPLTFQNPIHLNGNLIVKGQINGLNLNEDILLAKGDQDFTRKHFDHRPLMFQSSTSTKFQNLTIELLNNRFRPEQFLLRRRPSPTSMANKVYLRRKYFNNDLYVQGYVNVQPNSLTNNVDLSDIYFKLDTMVSMSTPVIAKQIVIGQAMFTNYFNQFDWLYVRQKLSNVLLQNKPQTFSIPLTYNGPLSVSNLTFNYYGGNNHLRFPEDFINQNDNTSDIIISGSKYFQQPISVENIHFGQNGSVNGIRIGQHFKSLVHLNGDENIAGRKTFHNLVIKGNLYVGDRRISGHNLNGTIDISDDAPMQTITSPLWFTNVIVEHDFRVKALTINRTINGVNYERFWSDSIQKPIGQGYPIIQLYNKHFPDGIDVESIQIINGTIDSIYIDRLMYWAILLNSTQTIGSSLYFMNATFENIDKFRTINRLDRTYFEQVVRKDSDVVHIYLAGGGGNLESILGNWNVTYLSFVDDGGTINGYDIIDINRRTLKKLSINGSQNITGRHVFLKPLSIMNLMLPIDLVRINQIPIRNYVWLNQPTLIFNTDIIFENLYQITNLHVIGLINRCYFDHLIETSIKRQTSNDNHNGVMFNLTGEYHLPKLIIRGNARFLSKINDRNNFLSNLINDDGQRPVRSELHFVEDITVGRIYINNLINQRNLSVLLMDAVVIDRPQEITGRKIFRNPLKIQGNIDQAKGRRLLINDDGHFNRLNLTDLFRNVVRVNDTRSIYGNKIFTGNITFGRSIKVRETLNGIRFPDEFVLTYTNETINSQANFNRKVRIHRNLNAQLINHINVTRFVHNGILINDNNPRQVLSTVRFKHPIRIRNLTVYHRINDIPVDDLIFKSSLPKRADPIQITGKKFFKDPLIIEGRLNVRTNLINNVDLYRDIRDQWIDRRTTAMTKNRSMINGKLIFEQPIQVGTMRINQTLNGVPVQMFEKHLQQMEHDIGHYRNQVERSLRQMNYDEQMISENFTSNFVNDIRYFRLHQTLPGAIHNFYPITIDGHNMIAMITNDDHLIGDDQSIHTNAECHSHRSGYYYLDRQSGLLRDSTRFWLNISIQAIQSSLNPQLLILIISKSLPCDKLANVERSYHVQFLNTFEFLSSMSSDQLDENLLKKNLYRLPDKMGHHIHSARLFTIFNQNYLLIYYRWTKWLRSKPGEIHLFKYNESYFGEMLNNNLIEQVWHYDLYEFSDTILLSIIIGGDGSNQTMAIYYWNNHFEHFEPYVLRPTIASDHYSFTRIIPLPERLLILYSKSSNNCHNQMFGTSSSNTFNNIELYQLIRTNNGTLLSLDHYQQLNTMIKTIQQIHIIQTDPSLTYLIISSSSSLVQIYRYDGNKILFREKLKFRIPKPITQINHYQINDNNLYLTIGSNQYSAMILSAVISGRLSSNSNNNVSINRTIVSLL